MVILNNTNILINNKLSQVSLSNSSASTSNTATNNNNYSSSVSKLVPSSNLIKKNSFTDRANKLIKQFELLNTKLESNRVVANKQSIETVDGRGELTEEDKTFINSLLLPSQYIDLSLFFYSPHSKFSDSNPTRDEPLQTSTDSSILTSSTLSNSSSNTSTSFSFNNSDIQIMNTNNTNTNITTTNNNNNTSSSDEHEELIAEMDIIERLPTQERLRQAKRRRQLQLKKYDEYDKTCDLEAKNKLEQLLGNSRSIKFQHHIVLLDAIMRKDYDEVEKLLKSGVTANSANEDGLTAIHQCCIDDSADLLKLLIKYGADVNVCDNDLWTPLHAAATCANLEICKILIENNADLLAVNTDGNMPYDICEDEVCLEYIESEMASRGVTQQTIDLKRSESEFRMLDDLKILCLDLIYSYMNKTGFKNLANLNLNDRTHQMIFNNNFFAYFTNPINSEGKLDLNSKDHNGATLMHIACANGYNSVIEFVLVDCQKLIETGAPISPASLLVKDNDGWTPLHVATFWGHQRAIEILLENGADINTKTNNDETVLELCDDPDVRDFIIQKSKEIESEQQKQAAARAAAAMQMKMQMISNSNNSLSNGSIKNGNNSSSRSLKRTSTGVSRSSSVRRSSFREKEKAARKLDTSFKDFLYATEIQESQNNEFSMGQNDSNGDLITPHTNTFQTQYITLNEENENCEDSFSNKKSDKTDLPINPIIINHKDQSDSTKTNSIVLRTNNNINNTDQMKKITSVVKIINNTNKLPPPAPAPPTIQIQDATPPHSAYSSTNKNFIDDFNNNQLRLNNTEPTINNSTLTTVSQIARIQSNGSYLTGNSAMASSNYSMTASLVSSSSMPVVNSSVNNTSNNVNTNSSINSNHTVSTSSIAIIDVHNQSKNSKDLTPTKYPAIVSQVNTKQPTVLITSPHDDGVKYKFISNQTIGGKSNTEFDDINIESGPNRKFKCLKCCSVM